MFRSKVPIQRRLVVPKLRHVNEPMIEDVLGVGVLQAPFFRAGRGYHFGHSLARARQVRGRNPDCSYDQQHRLFKSRSFARSEPES